MAHYLAELISALENATDHDREKLSKECFDTILKLWAHRKSLPCDNRPLESFEPIFRQIENMNPTCENLRYFSRPTYQRAHESDETLEWLQAAEACDEAARSVVRFCLAQATRSAMNKEAEWVQLAQSSASVDLLELESFERLSDLASYLSPEYIAQMPEYRRKSVIGKLTKLSEKASTVMTMLGAEKDGVMNDE